MKAGDVLIIRSGMAEDLAAMNSEQQLEKMIASRGGMMGIEGTNEAAKV